MSGEYAGVITVPAWMRPARRSVGVWFEEHFGVDRQMKGFAEKTRPTTGSSPAGQPRKDGCGNSKASPRDKFAPHPQRCPRPASTAAAATRAKTFCSLPRRHQLRSLNFSGTLIITNQRRPVIHSRDPEDKRSNIAANRWPSSLIIWRYSRVCPVSDSSSSSSSEKPMMLDSGVRASCVTREIIARSSSASGETPKTSSVVPTFQPPF